MIEKYIAWRIMLEWYIPLAILGLIAFMYFLLIFYGWLCRKREKRNKDLEKGKKHDRECY